MWVTISGCEKEVSTVSREEYQPRPHFLTTGDPAAGRQAFLNLECNACHAVAGESWISKSLSDSGPELGNMQAGQSADQIAMSIVSPSHAISQKPGPWRESVTSSMQDYGNKMTVRQLLDVVAYVRSFTGTKDGVDRSRDKGQE